MKNSMNKIIYEAAVLIKLELACH